MRYVVRFEIDESGWWFVSVPAVKGCHTQARTIARGLERIREALALYIGDAKAERAELAAEVKLPAPAERAVRNLGETRKELERLQEHAAQLSRDAVSMLVGAGLSVRDAARLLDLSHQRVHQLAKAQPTAKRRERAGRGSQQRRAAGDA